MDVLVNFLLLILRETEVSVLAYVVQYGTYLNYSAHTCRELHSDFSVGCRIPLADPCLHNGVQTKPPRIKPPMTEHPKTPPPRTKNP